MDKQKDAVGHTPKYIPPSTWHMTPEQRLARLRLYVSLMTECKGRAAQQLKRYLEEIEELIKRMEIEK